MRAITIKKEWLAGTAGTPEQRRAVAESIAGNVQWITETEGYCACPGEVDHNNHTGHRDCRVYVDEIPNFHCFHISCSGTREVVTERLRNSLACLYTGAKLPEPSPVQMERIRERQYRYEAEQALVTKATAFWPMLLAEFAWDEKQLAADNGTTVAETGPRHARQLLQLFKPTDIVWIGERIDSGQAHHAACFRPAAEWLAMPEPPIANFTCPSTFRPGTVSRSNESVAERRFLVVESDSRIKAEVLAAFNWCRRFMRLRAIVDTAGKSIHGWFDYPSADVIAELKGIFPAWGFDPAMFKASQPCRLPGTRRKDKEGQPWQGLLWLDNRPMAVPHPFQLPSAAMVSKVVSTTITFTTAQDIWRADYPVQKWAVDGIIPVGLTLLCGRPKIGKSYLTLGIALSIAAGDDALGVHVQKQGVLMLALEDTSRRIQKRMKQMRAKAPEGRLLIRTTTDGWPRLDAGGHEMLDQFLAGNRDIGVVVIDTLQKVKPGGKRNQNAYESDYDAIGGLHTLAAKYGVAVILVHHTRKSEAEDVFDEISGSLGLSGVADTNIVIKKSRGSADAVMHITGRDVEERERAIQFNENNGTWMILGDATEFHGCRNRQLICELLTKTSETMTLKEIREALEFQKVMMTDGALKTMLWRMVEEGDISRPFKNAYGRPYAKIVTQTTAKPSKENDDDGWRDLCDSVTSVTSETCVTGKLSSIPEPSHGHTDEKSCDRPRDHSQVLAIGVDPEKVTRVTDISMAEVLPAVPIDQANPDIPPPIPSGLHGTWCRARTLFDDDVWRWQPEGGVQ